MSSDIQLKTSEEGVEFDIKLKAGGIIFEMYREIPYTEDIDYLWVGFDLRNETDRDVLKDLVETLKIELSFYDKGKFNDA